METVGAAFGLLIIAVMAVGGIIVRHDEKRIWNGGFHAKCWGPWVSFDVDSQGGRGYNCATCGKSMWVSYGVDKKPALLDRRGNERRG